MTMTMISATSTGEAYLRRSGVGGHCGWRSITLRRRGSAPARRTEGPARPQLRAPRPEEPTLFEQPLRLLFSILGVALSVMLPRDRAAELRRMRRIYAAAARTHVYDLVMRIGLFGESSRLRRQTVGRLDMQRGARVLDLGCGTGLNFEALLEAVGSEGEVVGLDLTPEMLERAAARSDRCGWSNVRLVQGDAASLPFGSDEFDAVCSTFVLSAVATGRTAVGEAWRVLLPGGRIAVREAAALRGRGRWLAPVVHPLYRHLTAWDPNVDIPAAITEVAGRCEVEPVLGGLHYIAWAEKAS